MDTLPLEKRASRSIRLPRSRSTSNMLDILHGRLSVAADKHRWTPNVPSKDLPELSTSSERGRWSMKSLGKEWKTKTHSQSFSHPANAISSKTTPSSGHGHFSRSRSQSSSALLAQERPEKPSLRKGWGLPFMTSVSSKTLPWVVRPEMQGSVENEDHRPNPLARMFSSADMANTVVEPVEEFYGCKPVSRENEERKLEQPNLYNLGNLHASQQCLRVNTGDLTQPTLTLPDDQLLPESPGFPNMLAAMTFPSPPTISRPVCLDKRNTDPPAVRPRTSSKRAHTSNGVPTASLDELLMHPMQPLTCYDKSTSTSGLPFVSSSCPTANFIARNPNTMVVATQDSPLSIDDSESQFSPGICTTPSGVSHDSATPTTSDNMYSPRQSLASDITAMTSSPLQGPPTTNNAYTLLMRSTTTDTQSSAADAKEVPSDPKTAIPHIFTHQRPVISQMPAQFHGEKDPIFSDSILQGYKQSFSNKADTPEPEMILLGRDVGGRGSIVERRIVRRAKVQAHKRRDLDAARLALKAAMIGPKALEPKDSPILGRFANNDFHPRRRPHWEPPMARMSQTTSTQDWPASRNKQFLLSRRNPDATAPTRAARMVDVGPSNRPQSNDWTISPIISTEIVPEHHPCDPTPFSTSNGVSISLSPLMVVVDSKPQPNLSASSESSAPSPTTTHPSSKPALRHNLKILPQPRQRPLSVLIHKNPETGDIERTVSTTNKSIRHSMASMPTPPSSPGILALMRSHPTGITSIPQPPTIHSTPTSQLEGPDQDITTEEERDEENKWRVASIQERLQKEKLAKEQEISELVEGMIITSNITETDERDRVEESLGEHTAQHIERRLRRLEENGDTWLRVMKTSLENMSRTLEEVRGDSSRRGLTVGELTTNMDVEARHL